MIFSTKPPKTAKMVESGLHFFCIDAEACKKIADFEKNRYGGHVNQPPALPTATRARAQPAPKASNKMACLLQIYMHRKNT